jgi:hypothetical protein
MESAFGLQENPSDSLFEELALATTDSDFGCCPLSAQPAAEARRLKNPFAMKPLKAWRESSSHE